jgi:hypothetical protein
MIENLSEIQVMQLIATIVTKHGCTILEVDLKNRILDIDGPAEAKIKCARELEAILDEG